MTIMNMLRGHSAHGTQDQDHSSIFKPMARSRFGCAFLAGLLLVNQTVVFAGGGCLPTDIDGDDIVTGKDLAVLLGQWGQKGPASSADINNDCSVDGKDLAALLGSWGSSAEPGAFQDMNFENYTVDMCMGRVSHPVTFTGGIMFDQVSGQIFGPVFAEMEGGAYVHLEIQSCQYIAMTDMSKISINGNDPSSTVSVNGMEVQISTVLDKYMEDIESGLPPTQWSPSSLCSHAFSSLAESELWGSNVCSAQYSDSNAGFAPGCMCKFAAYAAATIIAGLAAAGCFALTGGCAIGTTVTIGGLAIPCVSLVGLCAGGAFAGTAAAYEVTLAAWGG